MDRIRYNIRTGETTIDSIPRAEVDALIAANTPEPVPHVVTRVQLVLALDAAGLLAGVEAAVDAAGGETKLRWEHAALFERNNALLVNLAMGLGLTSQDIDNLYIVAGNL